MNGYVEIRFTPGFWKHKWIPIEFTLVVDDFRVKYIGKQHTNYLIEVLKKHCEISEEWEGSKYYGLALDWDYAKKNVHFIYVRVCGQVTTQFQEKISSRPQH